jgi:hypothetical protein
MRSIILIFFGLSLMVSAQVKSPRSCRIIFLKAPQNAPETLQLFDGVTSQEVELPAMNFSPVYEIAAAAKSLRLLSKAPAKPEDISSTAPEVKIAEDVTDFYLFVASDPANSEVPVRFSLIRADQGSFRNGQMLWFNLSDKMVGGQLGSQRLSIAPNARSVIDAPSAQNGDFKVALGFYMPDDKRLYPLTEAKWQFDPTVRKVYFIVNEPGVRAPRVMGFPDRREPKVKAASVPTQ